MDVKWLQSSVGEMSTLQRKTARQIYFEPPLKCPSSGGGGIYITSVFFFLLVSLFNNLFISLFAYLF